MRLVSDAFVPWVLRGPDAKSTQTIASATDVKTMPPVSTKSGPTSAPVPADSPGNSARPKSPFVPLPSSAPARMEVNALTTLLITLASVSRDSRGWTALTTSTIAWTTCAKMAGLVSTGSTSTLAVARPNTAVNSAKLSPWWPKCTNRPRLAHNTIVSMESVSNRLEVTTTFANVPPDIQVLHKIDKKSPTKLWLTQFLLLQANAANILPV